MDNMNLFNTTKKEEVSKISVDNSNVDTMDLFGGKKEPEVTFRTESPKKVIKAEAEEIKQPSKPLTTLKKELPKEQTQKSDLDVAKEMKFRTSESKSVPQKREKIGPDPAVRLRRDPREEDTSQFNFRMETKAAAPVKKSTEKADTKESVEDKKPKQEKIELFRFEEPSVANLAVDTVKYKILERKFRKGRSILALDEDNKPFMYFYQLGNELMAYKYVGSSLTVRIPAYVGNIPVRYVYSRLFSDRISLVNKVGMRNLKENLTGKSVLDVNKQSLKESLGGVQNVIFPNTLVELPTRLFYHCYSVKEVVIPAEVKHVSKAFLTSSSVKRLYFNGNCPEETHHLMIDQNIFVYIGGEA